ncbi:hypothetical protein MCOR25_006859 [Pyricularia grisea]|nr:hypothetical protein MCOR25_006859 [Pyricularia grisea]
MSEIVPDFQDDTDGDSAIDVPFEESLTSVRSSIFAFQQENGRTYHAMSAGKYFLPNDHEEVQRLDLQHYVMIKTLNGRHCLCPKNETATSVLDLGTGTGIWAIEYADAHPEAHVIGVDLSPVQPEFAPPNCTFEIDDLEKEWTWSTKFDFIFARMMTGSFSENRSVVEKVFDQLEPGGYFEAQDMALPLGCDDGTLKPDSDFWKWCTLVMDGMKAFGRPVAAAQEWKKLMEDVGFEDVVETVYKWPTNQWPRDPFYKELGTWSLMNMDAALEPSTMVPLTRALGWSKDEVTVLVAKARKELRDPRIHAYWPIYVVYGRKPLRPTAAAWSPEPVPTATPAAAPALGSASSAAPAPVTVETESEAAPAKETAEATSSKTAEASEKTTESKDAKGKESNDAKEEVGSSSVSDAKPE